MNKHQTKLKEKKMTEFILLEIFSFSIVVAILDYISIQPQITSINLYLLLLVVTAMIYKPVRLLLARSVSFTSKTLFLNIKSFCSTAISFILHK